MEKQLAQILSECREQADKTVQVIDKLIAASKEAGIEWPELEESKMFPIGAVLEVTAEYSEVPHHLSKGTLFIVYSIDDDFYYTEKLIGEPYVVHRYIHKSVTKLSVKEVSSFNDVE